jgi:PhnB protein
MTNEAALNQTVTAYLAVEGGAAAIEFYKKAFGATERFRIPGPDGKVGHAELFIGNSLVYLADEWPEGDFLSPRSRGGSTVFLGLEVDDADAVFERAVAAGATVNRPMRDEPYGRTGDIVDPFGHRWSILTVNPNFKPEDMGGLTPG